MAFGSLPIHNEFIACDCKAERERCSAYADRRLNHVIKGSVGAALTAVEIAELLLRKASKVEAIDVDSFRGYMEKFFRQRWDRETRRVRL